MAPRIAQNKVGHKGMTPIPASVPIAVIIKVPGIMVPMIAIDSAAEIINVASPENWGWALIHCKIGLSVSDIGFSLRCFFALANELSTDPTIYFNIRALLLPVDRHDKKNAPKVRLLYF